MGHVQCIAGQTNSGHTIQTFKKLPQITGACLASEENETGTWGKSLTKKKEKFAQKGSINLREQIGINR